MSVRANIWEHPKTSVAGVLIAVVTVVGVLSQQGITLGNAGTGTVVSLIGALATALLGLLAKDPGGGSTTSVKLGAWLLVALLLPAGVLTSCTVTASQLKSDAQALATALTDLAAVLTTEDSATASKLEVAAESLTAVVDNWDTSSSMGELNTAAVGVETVLAGISATSKYEPLVAIAVAAVDVLLQSTSTAHVQARLADVNSDRLAQLRAEGKKAVMHRLLRSRQGDFKAAWNKVIMDEKLPLQPVR
ncbi:hypothetical protein ACOBR2_18825 [Telmatobacter bradus]|uniref:hypothetical protein n=1 Tax=Telmatobacter bradus TaxID=474953 RepID=UPI003B4385FF